MKISTLDRIFFRATARRWNRLISSVLCNHARSCDSKPATLNSEQLHILAAEFDPTQFGTVGRIVNGAEGDTWLLDGRRRLHSATIKTTTTRLGGRGKPRE